MTTSAGFPQFDLLPLDMKPPFPGYPWGDQPDGPWDMADVVSMAGLAVMGATRMPTMRRMTVMLSEWD